MDSDAAEAATPAAFFMASAALAATGIAMKESSSWQSIAAMWAGDDEELQKIFTENAPLALLALAAALAAAAGDIGGMSPEIFEGLSMSQETLSILEQGIGLTTTATSSLSGVAKVRHDLAKTGLSGIEDQISFTAKTQEKSLSFFSEIKQKIKTCCETLQQMIKQRSFV